MVIRVLRPGREEVDDGVDDAEAEGKGAAAK